MKPMIRKATTSDIDQLFELYFEFHQFHVKGIPRYLADMGKPDDRTNAKLLKTFIDIIEGEDSCMFIAEVSGHPVGLVEMYLRRDDPDNRYIQHHCHGLLESIFVREQYRKQGIGRLLYETARQWARDKGADEIRLETWEFEAGPLKFYERMGYHTIRRTLAKEL